MTTVNTYLTFDGNCEEVFNFYKSVFGGEFSYIGRFKDMPPQEDMVFSPADADKIMHIGLPVSKETLLMGCDNPSQSGMTITKGNNFSISVNTDSKEKADQIFNSLSDDGFVVMPIADMFWGDYFGMVADKFGINWMVSFNKNQNT